MRKRLATRVELETVRELTLTSGRDEELTKTQIQANEYTSAADVRRESGLDGLTRSGAMYRRWPPAPPIEDSRPTVISPTTARPKSAT
jgi:hypothetical protein